MSIPRFYIDAGLASGQQLELPEDLVRHAQVLRLEAGDALVLFNGHGGEYPATIEEMGKRKVRVALAEHRAVNRESPFALTLIQALSASDRMDYTMQKAAECGARCVQPIWSEYCSVKLHGERADKRLQHWQQVAVSACEQCGRTAVPVIKPLQKFDDAIVNADPSGLRLLLSPMGARKLDQLPPTASGATVLIGPEGGFSAAEEQRAIDAGFTPLWLGPRLFRTETVAPVISALLQARYGDLC